MKSEMTRKEFLQFVALGLAAGAAGSMLASCAKKEEAAKAPPAASQTQSTTPPPAADPCSDVSGLAELDLKMRNETLKYVTHSPDPAKRCDNCKFWVPAAAGQACGTCTLVKGPISPAGYCISWFVREA
jgi:hypothetical protein